MTRVLVPLADGFEDMEAITITDLLTRAGIEVVTAGLDEGPITASRGTVVIPTNTLDEVAGQTFDMIVLPGGLPGADHLRDDKRLRTLLREMNASNKPLAAICAAPKALAAAGVLDGKRATCFPGSLDGESGHNISVNDDAIVQDGNVITSRGPGTAMDFALTLIEILKGTGKRHSVEDALLRPASHTSLPADAL